ncbi:MAG: tripartite tricarboxylate transporter substrate-binding protein [Hyphomicrobiales bacterium]|nr:tripartite tricarboxylate transporter substrate-binding protein [Alphaproteobacteria bacterium]
MLKCRLIIAVFVCLATAGFSSATSSQEYPNRPVRIVVPFPPGGVADPVARLVALKLQDLLGQPVVIENRSGASGTLGVDYVTKSDPDGYTILVATGDFITTPSLMPKTNYDPYKDLMPVTILANAPLALLASIPSGFNSLNDVLTAARASPGKINFSSPGIGTINHLSGEWIGIAARVKIVHVPYRGGAPAATAVATGEVELGITTLPSGDVPSVVELGWTSVAC